MRKLTTLTAVAALVAAFGFVGTAKSAEKSDFALFDGTNPANLDANDKTGALCGIAKKGNPNKPLQNRKSFVYYVTVTADDPSVDREVRVVYTDGDFVRYKIPLDGSFAFAQAGGAGEFDAAIRIVVDKNVSGSVSARGNKGVFCLSCDELGDGDAFCDTIIPTS